MATDPAEVIKAATALGVVGGGAQSAHRILAALCDPSLGATGIAAIVQREPGLAARVLKVANSAFYGRSREVTSLDRALLVLGTDSVRGIAAAACLDRSIARRVEQAAIKPAALVAHCVASGVAAEQLARLRHRELAPEALIAGLLHDFGVLVQERMDPAGVSALIEALRQDPAADIEALERKLVRIGHARCAEILFDTWQLPQEIVVAASFHHDPLAAPEPARVLATLTHLGVQLAIEAGFVHPLEPGPLAIAREPLLALLGLEAGALQAIADQLTEQVLLISEAA
jgi:HD-like signal output (HDOD) protein